MKFPSLTELPPLTTYETDCWFYPVYEGRPYTKEFANRVIDLIAVEESFWRHLKYVKTQGIIADIYFDLLPYGKLSLQPWSFKLEEQSFEGANEPVTLTVQVGQSANLILESEGAHLQLNGDWSDRQSELGLLVKYLLPYMESIYIVINGDQASFTVPS